MSTEQENFDDLLKSKLEANEFAFNEANWDKAEALIMAADKKRKRRRIAFIFFIGLILGVAVMIPFINSGNKIEVKNKIVKSSEIKSEVKFEEEKINKEEKNNKAEKNNKKDEYVKEGNTSKIETKHEPVLTAKSEVRTDRKEKENIVLNSEAKQKSSKEPLVYEPKKEKKSNIIKTKAEQGRSENKENKEDTFIANSDKIEDNSEVKKENSKPDLQNGNQVENTITSQKVDTASILPVVKKDTTLVTSKDSIVKPKVDSTVVAKKDSITKVKQGFVFGLDAGASYALGWKNNTTKEANGFNAVFGANVTHFFTKTWSILFGLQYNSLAHLSYSNYTSNSMQYGFGYNQTKMVITPTIIKYLAIPVKMQYWFNGKNSLSIGVNALYLLNTNSKVETSTASDFGTPATNATTKAGYRDGLATWDVQPALAYKYCFMKGFSVNAEAYYGLVDIKNNNVFTLNKAEHNSGFKFTVSYIFIGRTRSVCGMKDYIK